ncbi:MAG: bifunctional DNA primase/polymerase, partial [Acidobacteria bacterium]|nr:bifunctional DNA primase/polymerase [Acidobacteriota bacterium]
MPASGQDFEKSLLGDVPPPPVDRVTEALAAHARGWKLTPLRGKVPQLKGWQSAPAPTADDVRRWAAAGNVGVRTGSVSGVVIADEDRPGALSELLGSQPWTPTLETGGGGRHFYFGTNGATIRNSAGKLANGLDIRGDGGQVAAAGSIHPDTGNVYRWRPDLSPDDVPLAPFPAALLKKLQSGNGNHAGPSARPTRRPRNSDLSRYAAAALDRETANVRDAPDHTRNDALNRAAYSLGQLVGGGVLDQALVERELTAAGEAAGLKPNEIAATIRSGLTSGMLEPRTPPETKTRAPVIHADDDPGSDAEDQPNLPNVLIPGGHIDDNGVAIDNGADVFARGVLGALPTGMLYRCAGVPGTLTGDPGEVAFVELTGDRLRLLIDEHIRLVRWVKPRGSPDRILAYVSAGRDHAQLVLDDARRSPTVRDLRLLVHRPTYVPGFELAAPGWNAAHGVYYDQPPSLADVAPEMDLDEIHRTLHDLTVDFPWKDAASRINFYGLLLTPMLRTAIPSSNVPLHLVVAALPRTGKTLLITEVVGGIHLGRSLPVTTWSGDEAEREKRALAILLRGGEFLLLDNLKDLDSPTLAALITSRTFEGRMLGRSAMVMAPNHVTIAATANNPRLSAEIAKRSIPIALQPDTDEPEARTDFNHP